MNRFHEPLSGVAFHALSSLALLAPGEIRRVREILHHPDLAAALRHAETIHLHVKVDDTGALPRAALEAGGARWDHGEEGFVKFRFPDGVNAIFSHIPISRDDLREPAGARRPRPFLDHVGLDLREVTRASRAAFARIPEVAMARGWAWVNQGGQGAGVRCCHVEVEEKHWLFAAPGLPIEIAFGPLVRRDGPPGCDLRPADPREAPACVPGAACCP